MIKKLVILVLLFSASFGQAQAAAVLYDAGKIVGVTGIVVDAVSYDVTMRQSHLISEIYSAGHSFPYITTGPDATRFM